jgi:hypothetical protein
MHDQAAQHEALTPEQHWNLQCHGVHHANEGITRTRNSGLRYIRRLIAGKVDADKPSRFTAAKLAAALKPIALPKFPSVQRAPRITTTTTARKRTTDDRHPDYAHCVEAVNHVNPVSFVDFAPAPPLAPLPPEPTKPIDPAEIPDLIARVAKLEDLLTTYTRQLGWDRTGSNVAENPATREYLRNRADDIESNYLPEFRQELAETKDRLAQSIALRDSRAAANAAASEPATTEPARNNQAAPVAAANTPATTDTTSALNSIITLSAEIAEASDKLRKIQSAAAASTDAAEKLYLTNLADEITRDDLTPAQQQLVAAQAIINPSSATPSPAPATAPTAAEPAPTTAAEPAIPTEPTDPEATAREAAALKEEWATLEDLRFGIGNELAALQRRKRHESHTPAWAAQAQDLFDRCVREKLNPTVMRQYTISQRLAQLGHKLE